MQQGREVTVSLAILNLAELNLHPRPCPWCSLFLCWKGTLISQSTNQPTKWWQSQWPWVTFKVIHLLQAFSNGIFHTLV